MSTNPRLIMVLLFTGLLLLACAVLNPPPPTPTSPPTGFSKAASTGTPVVTRTLIPSPSPTLALPALASFTPLSRLDLAASENVLDLLAEPGGSLWLLTDLRVLHYAQGTWTDYLSQFSGTLLGLDSAHRVWVLSPDSNEVSAWDGSVWTSFGPQAGWQPMQPPAYPGETHAKLATDALGQVWLATDRDVRRFDGARWKVYSLADLGMPAPASADVLPETTLTFLPASRYVWVMSCDWIGPGPAGGGGARWYDGKAWHGSNSPVASGCATVVNEDKLGNIWLGLDHDLWRLATPSGTWQSFPAPTPPQGNFFGYFADLALDASGDPWPELEICGGASCYVGAVRYHVAAGEWVQVGDVAFDNSSLVFDAAGQGWLFTPGQVYRIANDQLEPVAELSILQVAVDPSGNLWMIGVYGDETVLWAQALNG